MEQHPKIIRIFNDDPEITVGDQVAVIVTQDGDGNNVLKWEKTWNDVYADGEPSCRIPVCSRRYTKRVGQAWSGIVCRITTTGRDMRKRPGKPTVVEFRLRDLEPLATVYERIFFRYRNYIIESCRISFQDHTLLTPSFAHTTDGISPELLESLPGLDYAGHAALGKRVDWKRPFGPMDGKTLSHLLAQSSATGNPAFA